MNRLKSRYIRCLMMAGVLASVVCLALGILSIQSHAGERNVVFICNPGVVSPGRIRTIMEAPPRTVTAPAAGCPNA